ncbi:MAG: uracil-DNA glycosylase family protein [Anaerolineales bacterium]|nr:uracil-DNA glycosylase family protein [Anaerolineales bacterium]
MNALNSLNLSLIACERCPRLVAYRQRVAREKRRAFRDEDYWGKPVPSAGDPRARVLMVGLAPGAHGANRTGRMFTGDGSGDFLTDGLKLKDLYIVAVCHCAPPDNKPTPQEIANCRPYLVQHLQRLRNVRVILALGKIAFDGVLAALTETGIEIPTPRPAFAHGAEYRVGAYTLIASYHPSRQNTQTGRLTEAMFEAIFKRVDSLLNGR